MLVLTFRPMLNVVELLLNVVLPSRTSGAVMAGEDPVAVPAVISSEPPEERYRAGPVAVPIVRPLVPLGMSNLTFPMFRLLSTTTTVAAVPSPPVVKVAVSVLVPVAPSVEPGMPFAQLAALLQRA